MISIDLAPPGFCNRSGIRIQLVQLLFIVHLASSISSQQPCTGDHRPGLLSEWNKVVSLVFQLKTIFLR
jgi:hypothetical protein